MPSIFDTNDPAAAPPPVDPHSVDGAIRPSKLGEELQKLTTERAQRADTSTVQAADRERGASIAWARLAETYRDMADLLAKNHAPTYQGRLKGGRFSQSRLIGPRGYLLQYGHRRGPLREGRRTGYLILTREGRLWLRKLPAVGHFRNWQGELANFREFLATFLDEITTPVARLSALSLFSSADGTLLQEGGDYGCSVTYAPESALAGLARRIFSEEFPPPFDIHFIGNSFKRFPPFADGETSGPFSVPDDGPAIRAMAKLKELDAEEHLAVVRRDSKREYKLRKEIGRQLATIWEFYQRQGEAASQSRYL